MRMLESRIPHTTCPKVVLLILTDNVDLVPKFQLVEYFAGRAAISRVFKESGKAVFSFDVEYTRSMDVLQPSGFALLDCMHMGTWRVEPCAHIVAILQGAQSLLPSAPPQELCMCMPRFVLPGRKCPLPHMAAMSSTCSETLHMPSCEMAR